MSPVLSQSKQHVPTHFDESGNSEANDYRWSFDLQEVSAAAEGKISVTATYKGDLETRSWIGGCHLKWVYPVMTLTVTPGVVLDGSSWKLKAIDSTFDASLGPGSDTSCSLFNIPLADKLRDLLNGDSIRTRAQGAIDSVNYPIDLQSLWARVSAPISFDLPGNAQHLCIYTNPIQESLGPFIGTGDNVHVVLPIHVLARLWITTAATCPITSLSSPNIVSPDRMAPSPAVTFGLAVPYSALLEKIEKVSPGGQFAISDVSIAGHRAFLSLFLTIGSPLNQQIELDGFPTIRSDGTITIIFVPNPSCLSGLDQFSKAVIGSVANKLTSVAGVDSTSILGDLTHALNRTTTIGSSELRMSVHGAQLDLALAMQNELLLVGEATRGYSADYIEVVNH